MTTAAQLVVKVSAEGVNETKESLKGVGKEAGAAGEKGGGLLSTMAGFVGGAAIVNLAGSAFGFLKGQVMDSFQAGMDANTVIAQTVAGLKSTHDVSGQTAQSIGDLATHIMNLSGIDDDAVQTGENMLLTFTNIGKKVFPAATQAAADMATKMNGGVVPSAQQMQQASLLLGKALNDPTKGMSALQRVGVTLDAQQKAQIKTMQAHGDIAGAQGVILKELNKEFGGSAEAAGKANGGMAILTAQFNNMKENLGQQLIPILGQLLTALQPLISGLMGGLGGAISSITPLFASLQATFSGLPLGPLAQAFHALEQAAQAVGQKVGQAALPILSQLGEFFTQHLLPAVTQFTQFAATTLVPMFGQIATFVLQTIVPALLQLATFFTDTVLPAAEEMIGWFRQNVLPVLMALVTVIVQNVLPTVESLAKIFIEKVLPNIQRLVGLILPVLIPAFHAIGWVIQNVVGPVLGFLLGVIGDVIGWIADLVQAIIGVVQWFGTLGEQGQALWAAIQAAFDAGVQWVEGLVKGFVDNILAGFKWLYDHNTFVKDLVDAIVGEFDFVKGKIIDIWNAVTSFLSGIWAGIKTGAEGVWNGISGFIGGLASKLGTAVHDGVVKPIGDAIGAMIKGATDWGKNLIQNFIDGISGMADKLKQAAINTLGGLAKVLGFHSPAEEGPGADADTWAPNLMRMFTQGLTNATPALTDAATAAMAGVRGALSGAVGAGIGVNGVSPQAGSGLVAPSAGAQVAQALAASAGRGGAGGGGVTQQIILQLDRRTLAQATVAGMPDVIRLGTGVRGY